jgi:hypothetical protein
MLPRGGSLSDKLRTVKFIPLLAVLAAVCLLAPATALASAPTVTLTSPGNGGLIMGGQPTFTGSAGNAPAYSGTVTVTIYPGTFTSGAPAGVAQGQVQGGSWSATPTVPLPDGTYTAQASESDGQGHVGVSDTATFTISNAPPGIVLNQVPSPVTTPAPTFTGTASTSPGASSSVTLVVYPGSNTTSTPLQSYPGTADANGNFQIQLLPGLADGTYTAVAEQQVGPTLTYSNEVTITIVGAQPALTVTSPASGGNVGQTKVTFSGTAGTAYGDSNTIELRLYRRYQSTGTPLKSWSVTASGPNWSSAWPGATLPLGVYTLVATQGNNANGLTATVTRSFTVSRPAFVNVASVSLTASGRVVADVGCVNGISSCSGDVLILTSTPMQTVYGGPRGQLSLMFRHFSLSGGGQQQLSERLSSVQLRALRRAGAERLKVILSYQQGRRVDVVPALTRALTIGQ